MGKNSKTIIAILLVFGVMFYAYLSFFNNSGSTPDAATTDGSGAPADGTATDAGMELVALLDQLQAIKMDDSIFSSAAFNALHDETSPVNEEAVGRNDPFAPIGTGGTFVPAGPNIAAAPGGATPVTTDLNVSNTDSGSDTSASTTSGSASASSGSTSAANSAQ